MKQLYLEIICLFLFTFSIGTITAQTCSQNFTATAVSTPSTCQANGTITVTLGGDLTNIFNVQYGLNNSAGASVINPQENNVMSNIAPGTYTVTVRAFCRVDAGYNVVKTLSNVVVAGNYKVPSVSFNSASSRKSYDACNTGTIVLNATDGSGNYTFNITTAPAGVATGPVTPVKNGNTYTLPGESYPAGNYVIQLNDGCYTAAANFTLGKLTTYPAFASSNSAGFAPVLTNGVCNQVYWNAGAITNTNADFYRYYQDGMYEVAIGVAGGAMPTVWTPWTAASISSDGYLALDISPSTYSNFYTTNSLTLYTRLKGCPAGYATLNTNFYNPTLDTNFITARNCSNYVFNVLPGDVSDPSTVRPTAAKLARSPYDMICYPASILITKSVGGATVYSNASWSYDANGQPVTLDYNTDYTVKVTGANGKVITATINQNRDIPINNLYDVIGCDGYQQRYNVPSRIKCLPLIITVKDAGGNVVCTSTINTEFLINTTQRSCTLNYGQQYTFEAAYSDGYKYTAPFPIVNSTLPTVTLTRRTQEENKCKEDAGAFFIQGQQSNFWPAGTSFTITGPDGYTSQTGVSTNSSYFYLFPEATIPAGSYTLTTTFGCGGTVTTTLIQRGIYSGKNLAYTTENTCNGLKVTPTGSMTYQGSPITTYYRLTGGPAGYDKTVIPAGGSFTLSTSGTYTLGITSTNDAAACVINTKTITYEVDPLILDPTGTNAYMCVDNVTGVILLKAINGVAPYTYQLWDKTNTTKLVATDIISSGQVHFSYGQADSTYTARIIDQCSNSFSQQVTLANLSTARIVYATPTSLCPGGSVQFRCVTLGNTAYNWTGPNGYTSTTQNPIIDNMQPNMTGWYKVSVQPEFCGEPVRDSVYIEVYTPLAVGTPTNQDVCLGSAPPALTPLNSGVTGGGGVITYQWQSSVNGTTGWTNIVTATNATYTPPLQVAAGVYYYRVLVVDSCGSVTGNPATITFAACNSRINPGIRARGGR